MSEQVKLSAWLDDHRRNKFISIYQILQTKYDTAMKVLFSDIEAAANKYREELVDKYGTMYNYEVVDPSDVFELIESESYDFYHTEKLMKYNFHFSLLTTMYQIFEQQLRSFIYSELNHKFSPVRTEKISEFGLNMGEIKKCYNYFNYDLTSFSQWETIAILADLVNAYKHGDGRSANRLYRKKPELFIKSYYGHERLMDQELTTNSEIVFNMEKINFRLYANTLIKFWTDFPEHLSGTYTFDSN
jgi:hypothetical protein